MNLISIVIANFKNPPLLRLCLKSLARSLPPDLDYEVVVADSQSSVETQNVVAEEFAGIFRRIQLVPFAQNVGYTRLVNEGIKAAKGDYFLILNPDIVTIKGSIETALAYFRDNPRVGLLGPRLLNFDDTIQQSWFRLPTPLTILYRRISHLPFAKRVLDPFLMKGRETDRPAEVDWVMGSALLTSRQAVQAVGLMDERFFLYMSEVDWARRFCENGYAVVYYPQSALYHYHKRESKGRFGILDIIFERTTRWHILDAIRYFRKYGLSRRTAKTGPAQPILVQ